MQMLFGILKIFRVVAVFLVGIAALPAATAASNDARQQQVEQEFIHDYASYAGKLDEKNSVQLRKRMVESGLLRNDRLARATISAVGDVLLKSARSDDGQEYALDQFGRRAGLDVDPYAFAVLSDRIQMMQGGNQAFGSLPNIVHGKVEPIDVAITAATSRDRLGLKQLDAWYVEVERRLAKGESADHVLHPPLPLRSPRTVDDPAMRRELLELVDLDQGVRLVKTIKAEDLSRIQSIAVPRVTAIFDRVGFPTQAMVGRGGVEAAFLLVQHASQSPELMRKALVSAKPLMERGDLPRVYYALLGDREHCMVEHVPQRYGTQPSTGPKG